MSSGWRPRKSVIGWASAALLVLAAVGVWLFTSNDDHLDHISVPTSAMEPAIPTGTRIAYDGHAYEASDPLRRATRADG